MDDSNIYNNNLKKVKYLIYNHFYKDLYNCNSATTSIYMMVTYLFYLDCF